MITAKLSIIIVACRDHNFRRSHVSDVDVAHDYDYGSSVAVHGMQAQRFKV